jgi:hypothetical protein
MYLQIQLTIIDVTTLFKLLKLTGNGYRIATAVKGDSMKVLHEYNGGLVVYVCVI